MQAAPVTPSLWPGIISATFGLAGVVLGSYLSYNTFMKQKIFDNQRISFSKIISLKIPWIQSIQTHLEAKLLCQFYYTRFKLFTNNREDLSDAKKENDRAISLIKDIYSHQKEVFEALGLIQTCFKLDTELQAAIDDIFNYQSIKDVKSFPQNFKTQDELDAHYNKVCDEIHPLLKDKYHSKLDKLINLLKSRLIQNRSRFFFK